MWVKGARRQRRPGQRPPAPRRPLGCPPFPPLLPLHLFLRRAGQWQRRLARWRRVPPSSTGGRTRVGSSVACGAAAAGPHSPTLWVTGTPRRPLRVRWTRFWTRPLTVLAGLRLPLGASQPCPEQHYRQSLERRPGPSSVARGRVGCKVRHLRRVRLESVSKTSVRLCEALAFLW